MAGQSKKHSIYEITINIVIGFTINLTIQGYLLPLFGAEVSFAQNFSMGMIFTVIAVLRSYYLRRLYNYFASTALGQHPRHSFYESVSNIIIGYLVGLASQLFVFPIFNIHLSMSDNAVIAVIISTVSIIRSYILRRFFNKMTVEQRNFSYYLISIKLTLLLWWYEIRTKITS